MGKPRGSCVFASCTPGSIPDGLDFSMHRIQHVLKKGLGSSSFPDEDDAARRKWKKFFVDGCGHSTKVGMNGIQHWENRARANNEVCSFHFRDAAFVDAKGTGRKRLDASKGLDLFLDSKYVRSKKEVEQLLLSHKIDMEIRKKTESATPQEALLTAVKRRGPLPRQASVTLKRPRHFAPPRDASLAAAKEKIEELEDKVRESVEQIEHLARALRAAEDRARVAEEALAEAMSPKPFVRVKDYVGRSADLKMLTGLPSFEAFDALFKCFNGAAMGRTAREVERDGDLDIPDANGKTIREARAERAAGSQTERGLVGKCPTLDPANRLFLTLMFLRQGLDFTQLGERFGVSSECAGEYIRMTLPLLAAWSRDMFPPPSREAVAAQMPQHFKDLLGERFVYLTIDGMEVFTQSSGISVVHAATYSVYKSHTTIKYLVGVTPDGYVGFISKGYGGRISDVDLTKESGLLDLLDKPLMNLMADKGFTGISLDILAKQAFIISPTRLTGGREYFHREECTSNKVVANLRIHVERSINMIRGFAFFCGPIPMAYWDLQDDALEAVRGLVNLQTPMTARSTENE